MSGMVGKGRKGCDSHEVMSPGSQIALWVTASSGCNKTFTSARASSIFTTPSAALNAAYESEVRPSLFGLSALTSSYLSSIFPNSPFPPACGSGVLPVLSGLLGLSSCLPSSIFAASACPCLTAP